MMEIKSLVLMSMAQKPILVNWLLEMDRYSHPMDLMI